jgi:hypothetical protein
MNDMDGEVERAQQLEQLRRRSRQLERQRIAAGPSLDRARLVALDVELCHVEAARRMLASVAPAEGQVLPIHHDAPPRSHAEPVEVSFGRDVLREGPGATQRCAERRMARIRPPRTSRLVPR